MKILLFALFLFNSAAYAQTISEVEAQDWAEAKGTEILQLISSSDSDKFSKLDKIIEEDVDILYIAQYTAGKYWKLFDEEQKQQYNDMFRRYLLGIYRKFPLEFKQSDIEFHIDKIIPSEKFSDIIVPVKIAGLNNNEIIYVSFRIHRTKKRIKLIDLKIADGSLLQAYRNKIYELMEQDQGEIEWFLEDFETWIPDTTENYEEENIEPLREF